MADELNNIHLQSVSKRERSTSKLVRSVFLDVQREFRTWNVAHCREALASLNVAPSAWKPYAGLRTPTTDSMAATSSPEVQSITSEDNDSLAPLVTQTVYSQDGAIVETFSIEVIRAPLSLEPHPPYESCSPLHRSVFKGDDSDVMDFIPYADDATFDQTSHTQHYESFSWQDTFDPDLQVIVIEAVYRLQTQHALTYDEIEDCNILPLKLRSQLGKSGVLSTFRRRDRLHWPGNTIPASYTFPPATCPERSNFRNRLKILNSFFCPNLSCVEPLCSVHVESNPMPMNESQPSSFRVTDETTAPCQNQCFASNSLEAIPTWNDADLDVLNVILEISPNATPCVLAELCLKPCNEVFYYRKSTRSDNSNEGSTAGAKNQRRILKFNGDSTIPLPDITDLIVFQITMYCYLPLMIHATTRVPVMVNQAARVLKINRIVNATVVVLQIAIADGRDAVVPRLNRGGVVHQSGAHAPKHAGNAIRSYVPTVTAYDISCRNSQIQRGAGKALEVKTGSWGLGTFLAEAAKAGDLIAEYVGELIYEPTVESRADLAVHRNRCYVFGLNNTFSLDSTYAGNATRFINHSDAERGRRVNSQARVQLVSGEHRIGIFAMRDLEVGSEVLLNYGSSFFMK